MAANGMTPSIYSAPQGLEDEALEDIPSDALEIEIENPDSVTLADGSMEITLVPDAPSEDGEFEDNLAEYMPESELAQVASDLMGLIDADIQDRKEWVDTFVKGLEVLGMKYEERSEPWEGACGVYSTVLTEAVVRFQSEAISETFPAQGPVKTQIIGAIDRLKEEAAARVRDDMNYRLTEVMSEYRPEHERLLFSLGLSGAAFKKVYYDPALGRETTVFIPAEEMILPYGCRSLKDSERVTHLMRKTKNEVRKLQVKGFYRDIDLGEPTAVFTDVEKKKSEEQGYTLTADDRYHLMEVHVDYDMPGYEDPNGIALPYIVTMDKSTQKVLAIRRNWVENDPLRARRQHFTQYTYIPGFGPYGFGLIHLIGGYAKAGTSIIRQLVDAGTLSNLPGGLKARGMRIKGDDTPIAPGEFRDVDVPSGTIKDNVMSLPYKEPSQVLAGLLERITDEGRRLGSIADMKVSDMSAEAPVGTTLALLERQLKTMSAVQARVHASMKEEFKLLKEIIRDHAPEEYGYDPLGGDRKAKRADYDLVEVIPVSDPNSSTMAQRIMQYQAALQMAQGAPQIYDLPQLHRQMLEVLGIRNAEKLVPIEDDMKPRDPISENMAILTGKPVKAFIYQDHEAHIAAHTSFLQDPMIAGQMGQNPMAQQMQAAAMAHIAEHLAFDYRNKVEERLGAPMPAPNEEMPEQMEVQLSRLVAQAATQLMQMNQQKAAQQQALAQAQDPIVQMQQKELELKAQEVAIKDKKVQGDLMLKQQELEIKAAQADKSGEDPQIQQALAVQELQHKEQVHQQKMQHDQQTMTMKMRQQMQQNAMRAQQQAQQAAQRAAQPPKKPE